METLSGAIARLRAIGFTGNWLALPHGRFRSIESDREFDASTASISEVVRFEGFSDPGDASILFALVGPYDSGLYAAAFGADATIEDIEIVERLGAHR